MKTRHPAAAALLSLASLVPFVPAAVLPPRVAFAQSATDDASTKMARQRFQEGVGFFDKHQFEQARAAFLQAYALRKHPVVLLNLAQSSLKSGHTLESARYFQQFLHDYASATAAQRSDAESGLAEAHTKLGRVDVSSAPSGAEIWIDDDRAGVAPIDHPIEVEPGMHAIGARGRGGDESVQVVASAGQIVTARFGAPAAAAVAPVPAVPAPAPTPPAPVEEQPAAVQPAPPPPVETAPAPSTPTSSGHFFPSNMTPVVLGGVLTLAGFGTAIVMGIEKSNAQSSSDSVATQIVANGGKAGTCVSPTGKFADACSVLSSDDDKVNTDALIANIGLGVGIGAAVLTTAYFIFASRDAPLSPATGSPHPIVTPMVGKGLGGVVVGATF